MAYADAAALRPAREAEVDALFAVQAELRHRGDLVAQGVRRMGEEKEALERRLQDVMMATDVMEAWVVENNRRGNTQATEDAIEPADVLSRQMIECTAADLALEDTIYALDKAIQEGSVRALSREQFFHRALSAKVHSEQQRAKVASMAARAPQYAS
uniref:SB domain-containing protein n=1 Tax=Setaria italica TaxID=4555 RepID=K3YYV8_SETIT